MIEYTNGKPVLVGDVVHVKNRAYTVAHFAGDYVMLQSMCERRQFVPAYPQAIGARVSEPRNAHVHPTLRARLCY
jgi:hypothetical protein